MTGVEVTPISGAIWLQARESEVVSPVFSIDVCQIVAPESASKA
jgi:hypothetical protein